MNDRVYAIYARQSIDKKDSISIESQIEFCDHELRGHACRIYTDKGYSGKNIDRPGFQEMTHDIEAGSIEKVIVYKLDRISRSILDFANMMELFQNHGVEFVSSTEKFDTSTPMGRAMLNICIVFAQLERETIQKRLSDSFYSRSLKGLRMGGKAPFGFTTEQVYINGIKTKKLTEDPSEADTVKQLFEMYAKPEVSYGDIVRYLSLHGIKDISRPTLAGMLCNPIYVRADLDIYRFFKEQRSVIINEISDFTGTNGCYIYRGRGLSGDAKRNPKGHTLVLAPSEGLVSSELWLKCRKKIMANGSYQPGRKVTSTWLAGKIKCGRCKKALKAECTKGYWYFRCSKRSDNKSCPGAGKLRIPDMEKLIYTAMVKKLELFKTIRGSDTNIKQDPRLTVLQVELEELQNSIEALIDSLAGANSVLLTYVNEKIEELDSRKRELCEEITKLNMESLSQEQVTEITNYLDSWKDVSFEDKRHVLDLMVSAIYATSEYVNIIWKI